MRINEIIKFINKCDTIVDIGSDHALLSKLVIDNDLATKVYNVEKNLGPLNNSIKNTIDKKYENNIINILGDGFINFDSNIKINYCVISGMGSALIIEIISHCLNNVDYFLFCPNNNCWKIREWAQVNRYKIVNEKTIIDNGIYYEIILLSKNIGKKILTNKQVYFGNRQIKKRDDLFIDKLKFDYQKLLDNFEEIKKYNRKKFREIFKIKRYILRYENKRSI